MIRMIRSYLSCPYLPLLVPVVSELTLGAARRWEKLTDSRTNLHNHHTELDKSWAICIGAGSLCHGSTAGRSFAGY